MNIPAQIPLLDIVVNYLFGLLCAFLVVLYIWNFTAFNVLSSIINFQWIGVLIFVFLPYLIGLIFSDYLFAFMLRLSVFSVKRPLNKIQQIIGIVIFGIKQKPDGRITLLSNSDLDNLIKKKIKNIFSVDIDKLSDASKRDFFYVVMRFVDNYSHGNIQKLERQTILTNVLSSTTLFLLLFLAANSIALFISIIYSLGHIPLLILIILELLALLLIRSLSIRFQRVLLFWWTNVWRSFIVVEAEVPAKGRRK
jgi:hypothetical protein